MFEFLIVLTTLPEEKVAEELVRHLLEEKLAACCSVLKARSFYWWENKINDDQEVVVMIKTSASLYPELEKKIKQLHPYQLPEIIALPVVSGYQPYLDWIKEVTRA
ncbi:MAG: divalent-cation tolerance protein CutA [Candidatus Aminicenantes bacterium]|nr:divalent-cation tolerance protein CutA [Candidatus Aminicenantes bacterium]